MTAAPSTNRQGERDSRGRFAPGNRCSHGNPLGGKVARLRAAAVQAATTGDVRRVLRALFRAACGGDVGAAKVWLAYSGLGEALPLDILDKIDELERTIRGDPAPPMETTRCA